MRTAVISGHNNYWLWGPSRAHLRHVVVIGGDREDLDELCTLVEVAATTDCGYCMPYENRQPVYVCTGIKRPLGDLWPDLKHYD